ncbi:MAG: hypothetical protein WKG01_25845 [Kofleriaceae bacterium]
MKRSSTILTTLVLAAAGCAADAPVDDGGDDNIPGEGDDVDPATVTAAGKYTLRSNFDLATNAPGTAGDIVNTFIDATDDADDPTSWMLDQVINAMPDGTFKNFVRNAKPFVSGYINDRLLDIAPDLVGKMILIGRDFGDVTKNFGLNETLEVSGSPGAYTATRAVLGAHFKINNVESDHSFADYNAGVIVVPGVGVSIETGGKIALADHMVPLTYGKVLRIALDGMIVPALEPSASNLNQLFAANVNCEVVGEVIQQACEDWFGFGPGESTFRNACNNGLDAAANLIYGKLADIDGTALELGMTGAARVLDKNSDNTIDTIQTGTWSGTASYGGTPAPLAGATFFGSRM